MSWNEEPPESCDVVVVGSGFGGSVMSYRLAEAGLKVVLLERGKRYPPRGFPRSPRGMSRNFWDPSKGLFGLFNIWSFGGISGVVASGLGGGSLIYANVLIRKDREWFVRDPVTRYGRRRWWHRLLPHLPSSHAPPLSWPITRDDLESHYDAVEKMLQVEPYPYKEPPYDKTSKTQAFEAAAKRLNLDWFRPNLAVTFRNANRPAALGEVIEEPENLHRMTRYTCRLCGECDIGCNFGSKNTLDFNYLSRALERGAAIFDLCEVRGFEPLGKDAVGEAGGGSNNGEIHVGGYEVEYVRHHPPEDGKAIDTSQLRVRKIRARRLVLAAGTFGTTYLLLKMRKQKKEKFKDLSPMLGKGFSGNGDLLTFAVRAHLDDPNRQSPRVIDASVGTVITSAIRVPDELDEDGVKGRRGYYIQDAGFPSFLDWIIELGDAPRVLFRVLRLVLQRIGLVLRNERDNDLGAELSALFGAGELSSSSMPLLGMGRDVPDGAMTIDRKDMLDLSWRITKSGKFFDQMRATMHDLAKAMGARFRDSPLWYFRKRVVTVHALGGCSMGDNRDDGVVDSYGEVFGYAGLYVADGSVMPGPVGPNPALTIAALADRFADRIIHNSKAGPQIQNGHLP